jgi:ribosome-binding factor A
MSIRSEKVAELIRRDLGTLLQRNGRAWFGPLFITVTTVRMAPDLGLAKVYLSFMGVSDKQAALQAVKEEGWRIRKELGTLIGKQVRIVPELNFYLDDSLDRVDELERALKG